MTTEKRRRGRPPGSGKNDLPHLEQVARLLARNPGLKPTTAMKRIVAERKDWGTSDSSLLRRWQDKWAKEGFFLLAAAHERTQRQASTKAYETCLHAVRGFQKSLAFSAAEMAKAVQAIAPMTLPTETVAALENMHSWSKSPEIAKLGEQLRSLSLSPEIKRAAAQMRSWTLSPEIAKMVQEMQAWRLSPGIASLAEEIRSWRVPDNLLCTIHPYRSV